MNIFNLSIEELDKKMKELLKKTTPENLLNDLIECGYKKTEIEEIEEVVSKYSYIESYSFNMEFILSNYSNLHINDTSYKRKSIQENKKLLEAA